MTDDPGVNPSDENLMQRLQGGEDSALAALMARWEVPMKRFIYRIVGSVAEADDLAQEVFVRIYTKRSSFHAGAKFSTWGFSIAANQAKNRLRWWRRRPTVSLNAWVEAGGDIAGESLAVNDVVRREKISEVQAAVATLPLDLRTALVLFEFEGQSMADIAKEQNCTTKAVENRLYRARQQLKTILLSAGPRGQ